MKLKKISAIILSLFLITSNSIAYAGTWEHKYVEANGHSFWKYKNDDGTYANRWKQIDGDWYYFSSQSMNTNDEIATKTLGDGLPDFNYPTYFVGADGKMIKGGFCKVYDNNHLMFADSTGKIIRGFFMVNDVLYYVSTSPGNSATIMPNYRDDNMRTKFQCVDGKERSLHYIYDGGKVLELDGNPIKSDDRFYQLIKYLPKYDSKGNFLGAIQN